MSTTFRKKNEKTKIRIEERRTREKIVRSEENNR